MALNERGSFGRLPRSRGRSGPGHLGPPNVFAPAPAPDQGPGRTSFGSNVNFGLRANVGGISIGSFGELNEFMLGIVALKGAVALVEASFHTLTQSITTVIGAITQLGGARGVEQMMVESVTNQSLINQARYSVTGGNRMTTQELMNLTASLSEDEKTGAFSRQEWLQSIKTIGRVTGNQSSLSRDSLAYLGQMAMVTGSSLEQQAEVFSTLQAQQPNRSQDQIVAQMRRQFTIGQHGSFSESEMSSAPNLLGLAPMFKGEKDDVMAGLAVMGSLMKGATGANLDTAGSYFASIMQGARNGHNPIFGISSTTGQFDTPEKLLETIVNTPQSVLQSELSKSGSGTVRAQAVKAAIDLREQVSERANVPNDESEASRNARTAFIDSLMKSATSVEEWNKIVDDAMTPQERFRAAFNKIADELEGKFLVTLQQMVPIVSHFADIIVSHSDEIGTYIDGLVVDFKTLVAAVPEIVTVLYQLGAALGKTAIWIMSTFFDLPADKGEAQQKFDKAKKEYDAAVSGNGQVIVDTTDPMSGLPTSTHVQSKEDAEKALDKAKKDLDFFNAVEKLTPEEQAKVKKENEQKQKDEKRDWTEQDKASANEQANYDKENKKSSPPSSNSNPEKSSDVNTQILRQMLHENKRTADHTEPPPLLPVLPNRSTSVQ